DADEGSGYTLNLSASDPGADAIDHWTINWGDGTPTQDLSGNPTGVTHRFDDNGTYTISATATDEDGTWAVGNTVTVAVANVAPMIGKVSLGKGPILEGAEFSIPASPVDPSRADGRAGFSYAWSVTKDGNPYSLPPGTATHAADFTFTPDDNG